MAQLLNLPFELLQLILNHQGSGSDINAFIQTCRYLFDTFNEHLYRYDLKHCNRSVLFWAAERGMDATAANSLRAGPYTEVTNITGDTPLIIAATRSHLGVVKQLLATAGRGLDLETRGQYGRTALALAACYGQTEAANLLLEKGANRETKDMDQKSPLILAALNGHYETVKLFLNYGANVEVKDDYGRTALAWAAEHGRSSIVDLLLEQGSVVDSRTVNNGTPLILAVRNGHDTVVKRLLEAGADPNASSAHGWTVLHHAAYNPNGPVVRHLLEAGSDPRATITQNLHQGRTPANLVRLGMMITPEKKVIYDLLVNAAGDGSPESANIRG